MIRFPWTFRTLEKRTRFLAGFSFFLPFIVLFARCGVEERSRVGRSFCVRAEGVQKEKVGQEAYGEVARDLLVDTSSQYMHGALVKGDTSIYLSVMLRSSVEESIGVIKRELDSVLNLRRPSGAPVAILGKKKDRYLYYGILSDPQVDQLVIAAAFGPEEKAEGFFKENVLDRWVAPCP